MALLHFLFGIFGNATALFLFLAPVVTFWRIIKSRTTEDFSGVPYSMTLLNCLLSAWYGLPLVSPDNLLVSTVNGAGCVIEAVYVVIFIIFAPKKTRARMAGLVALVLAVFGIIAAVSLLALQGQPRKLLCGFAAAFFSICMYASPLSIIRLVIKTKSVEYMPFLLSLFVFLCGTSWFVYGLLGNDLFVMVPNGCGCALGAMQLILYSIYRNRRGCSAKHNRLVEMGAAKYPNQDEEQGTGKKQQQQRADQVVTDTDEKLGKGWCRMDTEHSNVHSTLSSDV